MSAFHMTRDEWNRDVDQYIKEMNSLVGKEPVRSPDVIGSWPQSHRLVTEEVIKNFAWNTGCNNPLYVDPEYAGKTRWGGVIAPPGRFVHYIAETGYLPQGRIIEGMNHLYGGTTYEYHDVIRPGDTFHIQDEFFGVTEKSVKEKPYRLLIMSSRRDYINQTGKTVVSATGNTVITCAYPENREPGDSTVYGKVAKPHYSKEELEAVHRHYEDYFAGKLTRGAKIRYWEDVEEGEKLTPIIKGPLDIVDVISFNCATGAMQGGGATKWDSVKNKKVLVDPDTGEYLSVGCFHYIDSIAQQMGFPNALTFAAQHEAYTSEIVTNWMGDDAFVKKLSHQQRRPSFQGDMAYVKGFVKKKYIKNEEHLIDIEMWTENQNGVKVCPSSATVRLVSREKT